MRKNNSQLRFIDEAPTLPMKRSDTSGNPSESYNRGHMAAVQQEWLQFGRPRKSASDLTLTEIRNIEARVRKELYP